MSTKSKKPKLYPFRGSCALCWREVRDFRPHRKVRRKLSPRDLAFCCTAHRQTYWRHQQADAASAAKQPYQCAGPGPDGRGCPNVIQPRRGPGRPQEYCSDECRAAAAKARRRRRPMAKSVERLLVTAKVNGDEYLKLKAERRILLLRFGSTPQAQQAFFQGRGGLAAYLVKVENELLQLEAKHGGPLAFGKWLNDSARKRREGERTELRLQLCALRRIVELEAAGGDEGRRTAMHRAWLDFFAKCAALARDAKDARDRRFRKRAAAAGIDADLLLMREASERVKPEAELERQRLEAVHADRKAMVSAAERVKPEAELERQRREAVHADRMAMVSAAERVKPLVDLEQQRLKAVDGLDLARAVEERANADLAAAAVTVAALERTPPPRNDARDRLAAALAAFERVETELAAIIPQARVWQGPAVYWSKRTELEAVAHKARVGHEALVLEIAALEDEVAVAPAWEAEQRRLLEQQLRTAREAEADKRGRLDQARAGVAEAERVLNVLAGEVQTHLAAQDVRLDDVDGRQAKPPESAPLSVHQGDAGPPSPAVEQEITHLQELLATDSRDVEARDRLRQLQRAVR